MRRFYYIFICFFLLKLIILSCYGQYYFKYYQVDDGLVHNAVITILQDRKGLIWMGTRGGGLNRFDGYTFKCFNNKNSKLGNIGNNIITTLVEDSKGMLWIGTGKGIFKYDPYQEVFTELDMASQNYISHLVIDDKDKLWFLSGYRLHQYDPVQNKVTDLKLQASCIALDPKMNLWAGSDDGTIGIFRQAEKTISYIRIVGQEVAPDLRSISKIYAMNDNELMIGCFKQGLKTYHIKTGQVKSLPLTPNNYASIYVRDIIRGSGQQYWVATESGIYIYDIDSGQTEHLRKRAGDSYSIADNAVYTFCKDNQDGMWVGTYFGGLNYYSKENSKFKKYYPLPGVNSISGDAVREIVPDAHGNLWIGTEDAGINKFNPVSGQFVNYTATGKPGDISYPNIHGLLALGNQLFIGPFFHGLEIMDIPTGKVIHRFAQVKDSSKATSDFVSSIYLTKDSTLLIGTAYHGSSLFAYDPKLKTFKSVPQIPFNVYTFDIKEDSRGNIWTGSVSQGAFFYNPKTGKQGNIRFGNKVKDKMVDEFAVYNIMEDSDHFIWFATNGGGLIRLSKDHQSFKRFTVKEGLLSNVVFSILEDDKKRLWVSSLKGLICLDKRTEQVRVYTRSNGLITDQFNYNSAYRDLDGTMYFGSVKGMISFNPAQLGQKYTSPPTYITGFRVNNKELVPNEPNSPLMRSIIYTDTITLTYDQNNFSIEFAALNYASPDVTRYKFRMQGLDNAWTYLNTNRDAYFTDLAPGNYTFVVQAESNTGNWVGREKEILIRILPPFWKTNMAYAFYALLLTALFYFSIRYYQNYLDRKNHNRLMLFEHEKEKEIYQAKIEFFTNIAHEIQTPLTLIMGPIKWVVKKVDDQPDIKKSLVLAERNALRLAELTSQLLDFRQTEADQFGLSFVKTDISALLTEQINNFKAEAIKNGIQLEVNLPPEPVVAFVDVEALVKIFTNLLSNALKYGSSHAKVTMHPVGETDDYFIIQFMNDGKGIPEEFRNRIFEPFFRMRGNEKPGTGIGLSLAKSLADLHNGSISLRSGATHLIIFELKLPLRQKIEFKLSSWKKK
ncbi:ligand-binding sensor domain-containing protein [Niabella yanshanensis]|nr:sensor histidine kinase [Niabella yanshanensis]